MKKISIVTAYHNRKELFYNTLKSINRSSIKNVEVIAVDDCSDEEHRLEDLVEEFPYLKIVRLEKRDKWYVNPCVPYNIGFKQATGDIIIIQNPECYHNGDILKYSIENLTEENYIAFGCYALDKPQTDLLIQDNNSSFPLVEHKCTREGLAGWYNHPIYRPAAYHFCSAITKNNLDKLNGFDERYAMGVSFDDDELLERIKRIPVKINITESPIVYHQHHYHLSNSPYTRPDLVNLNKDLFFNFTKNEKIVTVNLENENI